VVKLNPASGSKTLEIGVKLRCGSTVKGRVVGPDGKPMKDGLLISRHYVSIYDLHWRFPVKITDGRFTLRGLDPKQTYPVSFLDPKNQLAAKVLLSGAQADKDLTIRLGPCGKAVARIVNLKGKPIPNFVFNAWINIIVTPRKQLAGDGNKKVFLRADSDFLANIDRFNYWNSLKTDGEGRITFPALIPGMRYGIRNNDGSLKEFTVETGKTLNLGDIKIKHQE
jgi:hypothetical protein